MRIWTFVNLLFFAMLLGAPGCATVKKALAINTSGDPGGPIHDPFGDYAARAANAPEQNMILRTKKGDRSVEVEIPASQEALSDFVLPVSPAFKDSGGPQGADGRAPASVGGWNGSGDGATVDDSLENHAPTATDREIEASMPQGVPADDAKRREIEQGLGLMPSDDMGPAEQKSYLASVDHIKELFRAGRYEAGLLEIDGLIRLYQTDARLYEMRGTLLDRMGRPDLALKAWNQALRFNPSNRVLKRFLERREPAAGGT